MLNQYKAKPRTQKLLKRLGSKVELLMDSNPPDQNENYNDWMKKVGTLYKAAQPKAERKTYTPKPVRKARGHFTKDGQEYFEGNAYGGGFFVKQVMADRDQYKG